MPAERFYSESLNSTSQIITLDGSEFHHLHHVMRNQEGDHVELINGQGLLAEVAIQKINKKNAFLKILSSHQNAFPTFTYILAQGIPRTQRLDFILEKGTELGMSEIWLFPSLHSGKKIFSEHQLARMKGVIISAMKQSGRLYIPSLKILPSIENWQNFPYSCFFGDTSAHAEKFSLVWEKKHSPNGAIIVIGPEGGLDDREMIILKNLGAMGVKLHDNILRTDTAALSALVLMTHENLA